MSFPKIRLRRYRLSEKTLELFREVYVSPSDFVYPIFVEEKLKDPIPIASMPGQYRYSISAGVEEVKNVIELGIPAIIVFGIPKLKDEKGSSAYDKKGIVQNFVKEIRKECGERVVIITDVCLCQYTSHGHCGIIKDGKVVNDETLEVLGKIAISHAEAGADIVAPSGMMDGQVMAIREALDKEGFTDTMIMAYSAKFASCFYGPFREAAYSAPKFGDRRNYQMAFTNPREALREIELDIREGADIVMVKPALAYLDIIYSAKQLFDLPIAAYNVSGEYSMIKAAAQQGWIDEKKAIIEVLTAIKRAGADLIITYFAKDYAEFKKKT